MHRTTRRRRGWRASTGRCGRSPTTATAAPPTPSASRRSRISSPPTRRTTWWRARAARSRWRTSPPSCRRRPPAPDLRLGQLAGDVLEDPAVAVVVGLLGRVDAEADAELLFVGLHRQL